MNLTTVVHIMGGDGRCVLCAQELPRCRQAAIGDHVGVTTFGAGDRHSTGYRIGIHNKEARCDGAVAEEFRQASLSSSAA
jgi:hypothetical protein